MRKVNFHAECLRVVKRHPLIRVPRDDLRRGRLVERHGGAVVDDLEDLARREHAGGPRAVASLGALGELAPGRHAAGVLHGEAAAVEAEAERDALRVDVVPPHELETHLDLRQVGVRLGVGAEGLDLGVPDSVFGDMSED